MVVLVGLYLVHQFLHNVGVRDVGHSGARAEEDAGRGDEDAWYVSNEKRTDTPVDDAPYSSLLTQSNTDTRNASCQGIYTLKNTQTTHILPRDSIETCLGNWTTRH